MPLPPAAAEPGHKRFRANDLSAASLDPASTSHHSGGNPPVDVCKKHLVARVVAARRTVSREPQLSTVRCRNPDRGY